MGELCAVCGQPRTGSTCEACGATAEWIELGEAHEFARRRFSDWHAQGHFDAAQMARLQAHYERRKTELREAVTAGGKGFPGNTLATAMQCFACLAFTDLPMEYCPSCSVRMTGPGVRSLRCWHFLRDELKAFGESGTMPLVLAHELENEVRERIRGTTRRLIDDREPLATARIVDRAGPPPIPKPHGPKRPLLEILLDPHSIQLLLASGGGLIVVGLIIWLRSLGIFDNSGVVAVCIGLGNTALIGLGWAALKYTRFQTAGRALTLLACLVMPLNLWFYHSHDLITLEGHLWVAALICCLVYAASAIVLRDPLFVPVFCGGIALTGLLLLAEVGHFAEIFSPSLLLMVLAHLALHAPLAFPFGDGPFTRERFGQAFFWSAQVLLLGSLGLLLGGQLAAWLHGPVFAAMNFARPVVADHVYLPWTILLTLAGTYAYVYSDLKVRHKGAYIYAAAFTLLWSEVQFLAFLDLANAEPIILITLSITALLVNALQYLMPREEKALRTLPPLGLGLAMLPVILGVILHLRATVGGNLHVWPYEITWSHVAALAIVAVVCRVSAYWTRRTHPHVSICYFFGTAIATLIGAAGLAWMLGLRAWESQAPLLMLIPIAYIVASRFYKDRTPETPLAWTAQAATAFMIVCSLASALDFAPRAIAPIAGKQLNLLLALFALECAVFYSLVAAFRKLTGSVYFATAMLCGALWQFLTFWEAPDAIYPLAFASAGAALLIGYRFAVLDRVKLTGRLAEAAFQSANGLMSLGFLSGVLLTLSRWALSQDGLARMAVDGDWKSPLFTVSIVLGILIALTLIACLTVAHSAWRRWYAVLAIVESILLMLVVYRMLDLSPWQQLELGAIVVGVIFLILGHIGWVREDDRQSEWVTFCLFFGSILALGSLAIATSVHRFGGAISPMNEFGLVLVSVLLIGSGILCRLKSTTVLGTVAMTFYLLFVLIDMHRFLKQQVIVGIYLTLGGVLLFGTGLILSVYRDRLLALPDRIKRREGIFRILNWR